jgi:ABC-type transport system involved in cytochrome c biogenesis permease component
MFLYLSISLRLHFRNKLALLYSYLFPTLFLFAFWALYRYDQVPLVRHMGELLTVTALGGACFGLPTTMVSERERGVWRRYRLAPIPTGAFVAVTIAARYVLLLIGGMLQVALAMLLGMPFPQHPFDLWLAFTFVAFAFMGLGLVIAMLANSVPAVQALGQCVFLPMLIIGGVAVPVARLPGWAKHVASYFPGRYAVEAIQTAVNGAGIGGARFSLLALLLIGTAGCLAGARLFRWDTHHRIGTAGYGWVVVALAAWIAVGMTAETRTKAPAARDVSPASSATSPSPPPMTPLEQPRLSPQEEQAVSGKADARKSDAGKSDAPLKRRAPASAEPPTPDPGPRTPAPGSRPPDPGPRTANPETWRDVTMEVIDRDLRFDRLPPDGGVVSPIAPADEQPDTDVANQLDYIAATLLTWKPAQAADPVQRVRNVLFVAAVPDVFQMEPLERFIPLVVFEHLQQNIPPGDLPKILYWIALHPTEGDDSAVDELRVFKLGNGPSDIEQARERVALYGVKLLGRITGKIR